MDTCFGPLIWFDVPDDGEDVSLVALVGCHGCGEVFVTDSLGKLHVPDDHAGASIVRHQLAD